MCLFNTFIVRDFHVIINCGTKEVIRNLEILGLKELIIERSAQSISVAVSYTHLDVYKRQP